MVEEKFYRAPAVLSHSSFAFEFRCSCGCDPDMDGDNDCYVGAEGSANNPN